MPHVPGVALRMKEPVLIRKLTGIPVVTMRIIELAQLVTEHLQPGPKEIEQKPEALYTTVIPLAGSVKF